MAQTQDLFENSASQVQDLINEWFPPATHPYRVLERRLQDEVRADDVVLEIGCGRTAPLLMKLRGRAGALKGVDLVDFSVDDPSIQLINNDVSDMKDMADASIDLAFSRSVMEHVGDIHCCYAEINRVLKPGATYHFLTPNFWDYAALISFIVPNRFHQRIVSRTEGRSEDKTFPTYYRSNTRRSIERLAAANGFLLKHFAYMGQYPAYFVFNRSLFIAGSKYEKFLGRHRALHWLRGWILCELVKI